MHRLAFGSVVATLLLIAVCSSAPVYAKKPQASAITPQNSAAIFASCTESKVVADCSRLFNHLYAQLTSKSSKKVNHAQIQKQALLVAEAGCGTGADPGNGWLCLHVGLAWYEGTGGKPVDVLKAADAFERGCGMLDGQSCLYLGVLYDVGKGVAVDKARAEQLYKQGCERRIRQSCQQYAQRTGIDAGTAYARLAFVDPPVVAPRSANTTPVPEVDKSVTPAPAADTSVAAARVSDQPPVKQPMTLAQACGTPLNASECSRWATAYARGDLGLSKDTRKAEDLYSRICRETKDGSACYLGALSKLSDDTRDTNYPKAITDQTAVGMLLMACRSDHLKACEMTADVAGTARFATPGHATEARLQLCVLQKSIEDCEFAGTAYSVDKSSYANPKTGVVRDEGKALLAWLSACREHNKHCVEAADAHLVAGSRTTAGHRSHNLALGILETACTRGDAASCARKSALVAAGGATAGSYIDPMLTDNERYMLAKFDLDEGNVTRGRETMEWLAEMHHTDAEYALASAYLQNMRNADGAVADPEMVWKLVDSAANKAHPEAAMRYAVHAYGQRDNGRSAQIAYGKAIYRAIYLDADGAAQFDAQVKANNDAWIRQRQSNLEAMHRQNINSRNNMDLQTVQNAWNNYFKRQKEQEARDGGTVCGTVHGPGNSTYRTCMSRKHANKYYRGNF